MNLRAWLMLCSLLISTHVVAQKKNAETKDPMPSSTFGGLKFRSVGPALTSGRVVDFAVNPKNIFEYYVAVASGGVWKTTNAGVTYEPVFDGEGSYSIGCVAIDPSNPNVVWVGSGENNNQRAVAYGDGIYKSVDGGKSWTNMGLKNSEHIGRIAIDPNNSDIVYVAAYGPVWSAGGDRGIYKTTDGGKTWKAVLTVSENTGFNEVIMDPRNSNVLYAAAHQRRRSVFTYIGGGPESALYKSTDGGANWRKINSGLPAVDLGRIGIAISPINPDVLYAIVEAAEGKSGVFRSDNRGESWEKRGNNSSSGNYYQEIFCDPQNIDKVYYVDLFVMLSLDGGKSFNPIGEKYKHVDNHALWINPANTGHMLVGCDGGIYETYDNGANWEYKWNLPVTQFYKVATDNATPFYYIYGGTQDNNSIGGPSRTLSANGIINTDWFITNEGDGFESQIDPFDANIVYAQSQYGGLVRYDKKSG
ncbi:MAG TPA: glycosyl hydrolase, partial [bacterium]|nr:glycosyl hydrolase [bacterium]